MKLLRMVLGAPLVILGVLIWGQEISLDIISRIIEKIPESQTENKL